MDVEHVAEDVAKQKSGQQSVILFYKYHPLSNDFEVVEQYRCALERLCQSLELKGRILVGCSKTEGLNGTLSGTYSRVEAFTLALLHDTNRVSNLKNGELQSTIANFWNASRDFFDSIQEDELIFDTPSDFKWSNSNSSVERKMEPLFPDLNIKLTKELIGSGGVMAEISVQETAQGYLTPSEWHRELTSWTQQQAQHKQHDKQQDQNQSETILIDCRNTKEYEIGHFPGALDPRTTTYSQFSHWVNQNQALLQGKRVLMYCTGGIRCEKASAYIRRKVDAVQEVKHLKGGIHKYLEEFGSDGLWQGKNFVFDGRQASSAEETRLGKNGQSQPLAATSGATHVDIDNSHQHELEKSNKATVNNGVVGQCLYCRAPHDTFGAHCVCAVCREPILICPTCQGNHREYHCRQHYHLKDCYFATLSGFSIPELRQQLAQLQVERQRLAVGRRFKQKRKTLARQCTRVQNQLNEMTRETQKDVSSMTTPIIGASTCGSGREVTQQQEQPPLRNCRSCGDANCEGKCWGFYGLKRKEILAQKDSLAAVPNYSGSSSNNNINNNNKVTLVGGVESSTPMKKIRRRGVDADEIEALQYHQPPSSFRHASHHPDIRCPPCVTRVVQCFVKAKWCGLSVLQVLQQEFADFSSSTSSSASSSSATASETLQAALQNGLIKVNDCSVSPNEACHIKLKSGDLLGRVLHWHEPPVLTPCHISVQTVPLPTVVAQDYGLAESEAVVYVCNKPSSVPVHPAGPYLANTLTVMVEAQMDGLPCRSLKPIHRTDRATSGLTLLSTSSTVAKIFHKSLALSSEASSVDKLYLAQVCGQIPSNPESLEERKRTACAGSGTCTFSWLEENQTILVNAPIFTPDPMSGVRVIDDKGKPSKSLFKVLRYDKDKDTSIVACFPVTGRNHQLRVHLQALGCPILGDVQYGGGRRCVENDERLGTVTKQTVQNVLQEAAAASDSSLSLTENESRLGLSVQDVTAACRVCPHCSNSHKKVPQEPQQITGFTPAQLLHGGHKICLHALRYRVALYGKKKLKPILAVSEFGVDLPDWIDSAVDRSAAQGISFDELLQRQNGDKSSG